MAYSRFPAQRLVKVFQGPILTFPSSSSEGKAIQHEPYIPFRQRQTRIPREKPFYENDVNYSGLRKGKKE